MRLASPIDRIRDLTTLINKAPSNAEVIEFLSWSLDPMGEIAGVSWIEVDDSGFLDYQLNHGFHRDLDTSIRISIDADNIASIALRTQRTQMSDLRSAPTKFEDHAHAESLEAYASVLILPLTPVTALGIVFSSTPVELSKFQD